MLPKLLLLPAVVSVLLLLTTTAIATSPTTTSTTETADATSATSAKYVLAAADTGRRNVRGAGVAAATTRAAAAVSELDRRLKTTTSLLPLQPPRNVTSTTTSSFLPPAPPPPPPPSPASAPASQSSLSTTQLKQPTVAAAANTTLSIDSAPNVSVKSDRSGSDNDSGIGNTLTDTTTKILQGHISKAKRDSELKLSAKSGDRQPNSSTAYLIFDLDDHEHIARQPSKGEKTSRTDTVNEVLSNLFPNGFTDIFRFSYASEQTTENDHTPLTTQTPTTSTTSVANPVTTTSDDPISLTTTTTEAPTTTRRKPPPKTFYSYKTSVTKQYRRELSPGHTEIVVEKIAMLPRSEEFKDGSNFISKEELLRINRAAVDAPVLPSLVLKPEEHNATQNSTSSSGAAPIIILNDAETAEMEGASEEDNLIAESQNVGHSIFQQLPLEDKQYRYIGTTATGLGSNKAQSEINVQVIHVTSPPSLNKAIYVPDVSSSEEKSDMPMVAQHLDHQHAHMEQNFQQRNTATQEEAPSRQFLRNFNPTLSVSASASTPIPKGHFHYESNTLQPTYFQRTQSRHAPLPSGFAHHYDRDAAQLKYMRDQQRLQQQRQREQEQKKQQHYQQRDNEQQASAQPDVVQQYHLYQEHPVQEKFKHQSEAKRAPQELNLKAVEQYQHSTPKTLITPQQREENQAKDSENSQDQEGFAGQQEISKQQRPEQQSQYQFPYAQAPHREQQQSLPEEKQQLSESPSQYYFYQAQDQHKSPEVDSEQPVTHPGKQEQQLKKPQDSDTNPQVSNRASSLHIHISDSQPASASPDYNIYHQAHEDLRQKQVTAAPHSVVFVTLNTPQPQTPTYAAPEEVPQRALSTEGRTLDKQPHDYVSEAAGEATQLQEVHKPAAVSLKQPQGGYTFVEVQKSVNIHNKLITERDGQLIEQHETIYPQPKPQPQPEQQQQYTPYLQQYEQQPQAQQYNTVDPQLSLYPTNYISLSANPIHVQHIDGEGQQLEDAAAYTTLEHIATEPHTLPIQAAPSVTHVAEQPALHPPQALYDHAHHHVPEHYAAAHAYHANEAEKSHAFAANTQVIREEKTVAKENHAPSHKKIIERPIHIPYVVPVEHYIDRPYPVPEYIETHVPVPYPVPEPVPVPVHVDRYIDRPYPVEKIVEKRIPYAVETVVEKVIEKHVPVEVERIVEKPVEKVVQKFVDRPVPIAIHVPVAVPVPLGHSHSHPHELHEHDDLFLPAHPNALPWDSVDPSSGGAHLPPKVLQNYYTRMLKKLLPQALPQKVTPHTSATTHGKFKTTAHPTKQTKPTKVMPTPKPSFHITDMRFDLKPPPPPAPLGSAWSKGSRYIYNTLPQDLSLAASAPSTQQSQELYAVPLQPPQNDEFQRWRNGASLKRSPQFGRNLQMEYGFKPPLVPSVEIDDQGIPLKSSAVKGDD